MNETGETSDLLALVRHGLANLDSDDAFHEAVGAVSDEIGFTASDFANALPVDVTTAQRWIDRKSTPRPLMRKPVYRFLEFQLIEEGYGPRTAADLADVARAIAPMLQVEESMGSVCVRMLRASIQPGCVSVSAELRLTPRRDDLWSWTQSTEDMGDMAGAKDVQYLRRGHLYEVGYADWDFVTALILRMARQAARTPCLTSQENT